MNGFWIGMYRNMDGNSFFISAFNPNKYSTNIIPQRSFLPLNIHSNDVLVGLYMFLSTT